MDNNGKKICKEALKEAMRPIAGDNVNLPAVDQNFKALGTGISNILTEKANIASDKTQNQEFWEWVDNVNQYLSQLSKWQREINTAISEWQPTQPTEVTLKSKLQSLSNPTLPNLKIPNQLIGKIQLSDNSKISTTDNN